MGGKIDRLFFSARAPNTALQIILGVNRFASTFLFLLE